MDDTIFPESCNIAIIGNASYSAIIVNCLTNFILGGSFSQNGMKIATPHGCYSKNVDIETSSTPQYTIHKFKKGSRSIHILNTCDLSLIATFDATLYVFVIDPRQPSNKPDVHPFKSVILLVNSDSSDVYDFGFSIPSIFILDISSIFNIPFEKISKNVYPILEMQWNLAMDMCGEIFKYVMGVVAKRPILIQRSFDPSCVTQDHVKSFFHETKIVFKNILDVNRSSESRVLVTNIIHTAEEHLICGECDHICYTCDFVRCDSCPRKCTRHLHYCAKSTIATKEFDTISVSAHTDILLQSLVCDFIAGLKVLYGGLATSCIFEEVNVLIDQLKTEARVMGRQTLDMCKAYIKRIELSVEEFESTIKCASASCIKSAPECPYQWTCLKPTCSMAHTSCVRAMDGVLNVLPPLQIKHRLWSPSEITEIWDHYNACILKFSEVMSTWPNEVRCALLDLRHTISQSFMIKDELSIGLISTRTRKLCETIGESMLKLPMFADVELCKKSLDAMTLALARKDINFSTIMFILRKLTSPAAQKGLVIECIGDCAAIICRYTIWLLSEYEKFISNFQGRTSPILGIWSFPSVPKYNILEDAPTSNKEKKSKDIPHHSHAMVKQVLGPHVDAGIVSKVVGMITSVGYTADIYNDEVTLKKIAINFILSDGKFCYTNL